MTSRTPSKKKKKKTPPPSMHQPRPTDHTPPMLPTPTPANNSIPKGSSIPRSPPRSTHNTSTLLPTPVPLDYPLTLETTKIGSTKINSTLAPPVSHTPPPNIVHTTTMFTTDTHFLPVNLPATQYINNTLPTTTTTTTTAHYSTSNSTVEYTSAYSTPSTLPPISVISTASSLFLPPSTPSPLLFTKAPSVNTDYYTSLPSITDTDEDNIITLPTSKRKRRNRTSLPPAKYSSASASDHPLMPVTNPLISIYDNPQPSTSKAPNPPPPQSSLQLSPNSRTSQTHADSQPHPSSNTNIPPIYITTNFNAKVLSLIQSQIHPLPKLKFNNTTLHKLKL